MEEQITTGQVAKKWGLIYGLITTVAALVPLFLEKQFSWMMLVFIAVAIFCYAMATKEFKTANGGYMSFGEGFRISMIAALIAGVVRNVINYVYVKFIDPEVVDRMQQAMQDTWRQQGMSEQEIEQAQRFTAGFTNPEFGLIVGIIVVLLGGLIWGSIVSAINKNEQEEF
ncbi:DUF4199 domain-containing protein [Roseivirga sp.]|uniref:DUF4199 domain-containing protein n=1 Tax=Roseivirga sp. TaxID=1964215 RepID=UPI003B5280E2